MLLAYAEDFDFTQALETLAELRRKLDCEGSSSVAEHPRAN
jgi:hypothetical protein